MATIELDTGTDLMSLLDEITSGESEDPHDPLEDFTNSSAASSPSVMLSGSHQAGGKASEGTAPGGLASTPGSADFDVEIPTEDQGVGTGLDNGPNPDDLAWPEYLQRFKETFVKSWSLKKVQMFAENMGFKDFMDYAIKLMPKDVKIQGSVDFRHLVAELGPIDKEKYRLTGPTQVKEVEFSEVK